MSEQSSLPSQLARSGRLRTFQVIRTRAWERSQLDALHEVFLEAEDWGLDFWQPPRALNSSVDVMAGPKELPVYLALLSRLGLSHTVTVADVERLTRQRNARLDRGRRDLEIHRTHRIQEYTICHTGQIVIFLKKEIAIGIDKLST